MKQSDRADAGAEILKMSYGNIQDWLRHYETVSATVTVFAASVVTGHAALKAAKFLNPIEFHLSPAQSSLIEAVIPLFLCLASFLYVRNNDHEARRAFRRLVTIERALGFYEPMEGLKGKPLLDDNLQASGTSAAPMYRVAYAIHGLLVALTLGLLFVKLGP